MHGTRTPPYPSPSSPSPSPFISPVAHALLVIHIPIPPSIHILIRTYLHTITFPLQFCCFCRVRIVSWCALRIIFLYRVVFFRYIHAYVVVITMICWCFVQFAVGNALKYVRLRTLRSVEMVHGARWCEMMLLD